jgi:hypothetical protein
MGFLDKLLGRGKEAAQDVGDVAKDVGDKAEEGFDEAKSRVTGEEESEVTQSEQRLDEVRDETARNEGRIP